MCFVCHRVGSSGLHTRIQDAARDKKPLSIDICDQWKKSSRWQNAIASTLQACAPRNELWRRLLIHSPPSPLSGFGRARTVGESKNPDDKLTGVLVLATSYSRAACRRTTIGAAAFHFRVRNGNGWCHCAIVTRVRTRTGGFAALAATLARSRISGDIGAIEVNRPYLQSDFKRTLNTHLSTMN